MIRRGICIAAQQSQREARGSAAPHGLQNRLTRIAHIAPLVLSKVASRLEADNTDAR
jgi:hypothetical protein